MGLWLFYRQKSQVVCVWKDVSAQAPVDLNGSSLSLSLYPSLLLDTPVIYFYNVAKNNLLDQFSLIVNRVFLY